MEQGMALLNCLLPRLDLSLKHRPEELIESDRKKEVDDVKAAKDDDLSCSGLAVRWKLCV